LELYARATITLIEPYAFLIVCKHYRNTPYQLHKLLSRNPYPNRQWQCYPTPNEYQVSYHLVLQIQKVAIYKALLVFGSGVCGFLWLSYSLATYHSKYIQILLRCLFYYNKQVQLDRKQYQIYSSKCNHL